MSHSASHALDASVLVLNRFYMAVHVISVRRAFCLLFKELAEVITIDDGRYLSFNFGEPARSLLRHALYQGKSRTTISSARSTSRSRCRALSGS